jgi:hypothetical protein
MLQASEYINIDVRRNVEGKEIIAYRLGLFESTSAIIVISTVHFAVPTVSPLLVWIPG